MYILKTEIPSKKFLFIALQKIFGLGKKNSICIIKYFGISLIAKPASLKGYKMQQIIKHIEKKYIIGKDLKDLKKKFIQSEIKIKSYLGQRIRLHLPRRGQRTHTNSNTIRKLKN